MLAINVPFSLTRALLALVGLFFVKQIYDYLTVGAARRRMIKEHGCKPAPFYPHKDPIFGFDLLMTNIAAIKQGTFLQLLNKRFYDVGSTLRLKLVGRTVYSTMEPENIKTLLATKFNDYSIGYRRKKSFIPVLGAGIFSTDGAAWEHSRAMLRPNFSRSQVGDLETFETHVQHLINALPRDGSTVDMQPLFFRLTVDSATEFLFGESTNCLAPGLETQSLDSFADAFTYCTEYMGKEGRLGGLNAFVPDKKYKDSRKIIHAFADNFVNKAIAYHQTQDVEKLGADMKSSSSGRYIFLYELVKQTTDPLALRSELLNILLAGRDTTASLLANVWFVLSKRPDIYAKLRAEVDALGGDPPSYQQVKDMKYLRYLLNESLRLHPVVPGNARTAIKDTVLPVGGGPDGKSPVLIPAGTQVGYSVYAMHRRQDFYGPDAAEFKPERWETLRPSWWYLPFNGGPRICIGQQFALTEAGYTTIRLMQAFKAIESREQGDWVECLTLTCAPRSANVALTPA